MGVVFLIPYGCYKGPKRTYELEIEEGKPKPEYLLSRIKELGLISFEMLTAEEQQEVKKKTSKALESCIRQSLKNSLSSI
jgi:hypothetical protein